MVGLAKGFNDSCLSAEELQVVRYVQSKLQRVQQRLRTTRSQTATTSAATKAQRTHTSALNEKQQRALIFGERLISDQLRIRHRCAELIEEIQQAESELAAAQVEAERSAAHMDLQAEVQQVAGSIAHQETCNVELRQHLEQFISQYTLASGLPAPRQAPALGASSSPTSGGVRRSRSANSVGRGTSATASARPSVACSQSSTTPLSLGTAGATAGGGGGGGVYRAPSIGPYSARSVEFYAADEVDAVAHSNTASPDSSASRFGAASAATTASRGGLGCSASSRGPAQRSIHPARDLVSVGSAATSPRCVHSSELPQLMEETERLEVALRKEQERTATLNYRLDTLRARGRQLEVSLKKAKGSTTAKLRELEDEMARSAQKARSLMSLAGPPGSDASSPRPVEGSGSPQASSSAAANVIKPPVGVSYAAKAQAAYYNSLPQQSVRSAAH